MKIAAAEKIIMFDLLFFDNKLFLDFFWTVTDFIFGELKQTSLFLFNFIKIS